MTDNKTSTTQRLAEALAARIANHQGTDRESEAAAMGRALSDATRKPNRQGK